MPSAFPRISEAGSQFFTNPLNKLQGGVLRREADPLWVRRHLLRLEHQAAPRPPRPLKALLLPPVPQARGRFPLWLFFEAAKKPAKLLRVLAERQTPAAQPCRKLLLRAWRFCLF